MRFLYEWVMSHISICRVWHLCEWVMSHILIYQMRHLYDWVIWMGHGWIFHVDMRDCKLQVSFAEYSLFYRSLLHKRPILHVDVRDDPVNTVPWLIQYSAVTHSIQCCDSFNTVPWLIQYSAMTHSNQCHDSFIEMTRIARMHMCDMTWLIHRMTLWVRDDPLRRLL